MEEKKVTYEDFEFIKTLGAGAYGDVQLAKKKDDQKEYAIKCISKSQLQKEKKQYQVLIEKEILSRLDHQGVIKMHYSFQDQTTLYIAIELCDSGDFADYLVGNFQFLTTETVQFYTAEIILILEYLHQNGIAHRDLKPENILITKTNHLKIIDFGTALFFNTNLVPIELLEKIKQIREKHSDPQEELETHDTNFDEGRERKGTFVGSPQYVSPELLETNICGPEADLWALGCIIFKMFANKTPFEENNQYLIFQKIKVGNYIFPEHTPQEARDLIKSLLQLDPTKRLGAGKKGSQNDYNALKNHPFFKDFDWNNVFDREAPQRKIQINKLSLGDSSDDEGASPMKKSQASSGWNTGSGPVMQGIVLKKVGWMYYKKRSMVLVMNPPRLLYFDPDNGAKKGEIALQKGFKVDMSDKSQFSIDGVVKNGKTKKYFFKESQHPALQWVEQIKMAIEQM